MGYYLDQSDRARFGIEEPDDGPDACEECGCTDPPVASEGNGWAAWYCTLCGTMLGWWSREPEPPNELPF